jgi:hypothetical protein
MPRCSICLLHGCDGVQARLPAMLQCESRYRDSGCLPPTWILITQSAVNPLYKRLLHQVARRRAGPTQRIAHRQVHSGLTSTTNTHTHTDRPSGSQRNQSSNVLEASPVRSAQSAHSALRHRRSAPMHPSKKLNETLQPSTRLQAASAQLKTAPHPMPSDNLMNMKRFDILAFYRMLGAARFSTVRSQSVCALLPCWRSNRQYQQTARMSSIAVLPSF